MINNKSISLNELMARIGQSYIPSDALLEISKWNFIIKSPYSDSFYNAPVGWNYKQNGSLRIANHWNFSSKGKMHCETTTPIDNDVWAIARYSRKTKKYVILQTYETPTVKLQQTFIFKILAFEFRYHKAIQNVSKNGAEALKKCELSFLNLFYKLCEDFLVNPNNVPIFASLNN